MFANEPFGYSPEAIRRLTPSMILNILRGRNQDGTLRIAPPVSDADHQTASGAYFEYLSAIGINDPVKQARLYREYHARTKLV